MGVGWLVGHDGTGPPQHIFQFSDFPSGWLVEMLTDLGNTGTKPNLKSGKKKRKDLGAILISQVP